MPKGNSLNNITCASFTPGDDEQSWNICRQSFLINDQLIEARVEERQIRELPDSADDSIYIQSELCAGFDVRMTTSAFVRRQPFPRLGKDDPVH